MDLLSILPNFPTKPYTHLVPSLERNRLTTVDLITLDTLEIAKRAHLPPADIRRFSTHVIEALHGDIGFERKNEPTEPDSSVSFDGPIDIEPGARTGLRLDDEWDVISTLDEGIDELLDGGLPTGYLTEITGESGSGKTQFLLSLLLSVQLSAPKGLQKRAIYISTEAPLSTPRLSQMLTSHPYLSTLPPSHAPNLTNILAINAMDLESQDHILNYQLPVAVKRYNVGLVVIDSITANYRAEHTSSTMAALSTRSGELAKLGHMLRNLAASENLAVVVANQVSDRFSDPVEPPAFARHVQREPGSSPASRIVGGESGGRGEGGVPSSSPAIPSSPFANEEFGNEASGSATRNDILSLLHQQRFFTGWGDSRTEYAELGMYQRPAQKTPALGLVWSTQIASRIALKKETLSTPADGVGSQMSSAGNSQVAKDAEDTKPRAPASAESAPGRGAVYQNPMIPEGDKVTRRVMKLVMAPWTGGVQKNGRIRDEVEFEICKSGLSGRINKDKS